MDLDYCNSIDVCNNFRKMTLIYGITIAAFFLWASLSKYTLLTEIEGIIVGLSLLMAAYIKNRKIGFPKNSGTIFLIVFCLIQIPYLFIFKSHYSTNFFLLFVGGILFLLASYNLSDYIKKNFHIFFIILTSIVGIIYLFSRYIIDPLHLLNNVDLLLTNPKYPHILLGDLFSVTFVLSLYQYLKHKKKIYLVVLVFSIFLIAISFSRSALVSLGVGVFYLLYYKGFISKYKKKVLLFFILISVAFILESLTKSVFANRLYFIQAFYVFFTHPLGVGMGNFQTLFNYGISSSVNSIYTHSLFLEILVGTGICGVPFFIWLYKTIKNVFWTNIDSKGFVCRLATLAILINFTFNATYAIPVMFWIFFICLGALLKKDKLQN